MQVLLLSGLIGVFGINVILSKKLVELAREVLLCLIIVND